MAPSVVRTFPCEFKHWLYQLNFRLQNKKGWNEILDETFILHTNQTNTIPLFCAAKQNNTCCVKKLLRCPSTNVFERGALGETALHIAVMNNSVEAAMALMDGVPELINEPMTSELFQGITPLHIAVVNQNTTLVQQLICGGADVSTPRATGLYFRKRVGALMYYGEHILSFAACTGNEDIISMVISAGASTRIQDSSGNTLLHILVLQPKGTIACKTIDLVLTCDAEMDQTVPLDMVPNNIGLTPLKLAAKEGNVVVFQHLVNKRHLVQWTLGTVTSNLYDLTEIDSWADDLSVLDLIIRSHKTEARKILNVTPVKQLVSLKWNLYGKHYIRLLLLLYLVYMGIFTACCLFRPLKPTSQEPTPESIYAPTDNTVLVQKTLIESYVTYQDSIRLAGEVISVIGAIIILALEIVNIVRVGAKTYFGQTVLGGPFHLMFINYGCLVVLLCVFRVCGLEGETSLMCLSLMLGWINVMFFIRGFKRIGHYVIMIQKIVCGDMISFMWLNLIMVMAFATSVWIFYMTQAPFTIGEYSSFPNTLWAQYEISLGLVNLPENLSAAIAPVIYFVHTIFSMVVYVLMLNLLIAILTETHLRVDREREELWTAQVVATTIMLERMLPHCLLPRLGIRGLNCSRECWYLRVEDRNDDILSGDDEKTFQEAAPKAQFTKTNDGSNKNSLIWWQMIRNSTFGLNQEQERSEEDQGFKFV